MCKEGGNVKRVLSVTLLCAMFSLFAETTFSFTKPEVEAHLKYQEMDVYTGESAIIELEYTIPSDYHQIIQENYFRIDVEEESGISGGETIYPDGLIEEDLGLLSYHGTIVLGKEIHIEKGITEGMRQVKIKFRYQLCMNEGGTCLMPEVKELSVTLNILKGESDVATTTTLYYILLAFIGGIILNLMPCVLPVLTMRAFTMIKQSGKPRKEIMVDGLFYTLGIITSFLVLASVVTAIKLSGELVGWGFQFQNTGFMLVLVTMLYVFALSLFDAFIIQLPGVNTVVNTGNKKWYWGSFIMGMFAVVIATPCTAPILGTALGFAFLMPPIVIFAFFIAVGLGLGLPFLLISVFPAVIRVLPRPGEWMNIFKEILGFLLIAFAVKMLSTVYAQMGGEFIINNVLPFAVIVRLAVWFYGRFVTPMHDKVTQWIMAMVALLLIVGGSYYFFADLKSSPEVISEGAQSEQIDDFWVRFTERAVEEAQMLGRPVFIDFTAEYCMVCKTNEALVLNTSDIRKAFTDRDVLMLKGDYTKHNTTIHEWLKRYQKAGVPLYLLFVPGQEKPIIFPEMITKGMVLEMLGKL